MQVSPSGMAAASQAVPGEFDSRHLLQKEKRTQAVRFSFWKIKWLLTRVEGGENRGNDLFAQKGKRNEKERRQTKRLIIVCRGAPLKARLSDAHTSLFRHYASYTCSNQAHFLSPNL